MIGAILSLPVEERFPAIWLPTKEQFPSIFDTTV
jgi:hypothetical protein